MRARAVEQRQSDPAALFALGYTAVAAFALLLAREPHPGVFVPIAIVALPFTAAPRHRLLFRLLAAALLVAYLFASGLEMANLAFAPSLGALLLSAYQQQTGRTQPRAGRRRTA